MSSEPAAREDAPRYFLYAIGVTLDLDAQFSAIRTLLGRHEAADLELAERTKRLEARARATGRQHLIDSWVDSMHGSVYQDAAHSLAAVGMLAPLIESILVHSFGALRTEFQASLAIAPPRSPRGRNDEKPWDCHWHADRNGGWQKGLVEGTLQLSGLIGLAPFLPNSTERTLTALFAYRNKNFHSGLEWPVEERARFVSRMEQEHWGGWFGQATTDGKPWIIYMSRTFIDHCLAFTEALLDGLGTFTLEMARKHPR